MACDLPCLCPLAASVRAPGASAGPAARERATARTTYGIERRRSDRRRREPHGDIPFARQRDHHQLCGFDGDVGSPFDGAAGSGDRACCGCRLGRACRTIASRGASDRDGHCALSSSDLDQAGLYQPCRYRHGITVVGYSVPYSGARVLRGGHRLGIDLAARFRSRSLARLNIQSSWVASRAQVFWPKP